MTSCFKVFLISLFIGLMYSGAMAQEQSIMEDDMDFNILKWHYDRYPKTIVTWSQLLVNGTKSVYRSQFDFEGYKTSAIYTEEGKLILEEIDLTKNVPVSLLHYLEDTYEKFKIVSFIKSTDFESNEEVIFSMEIKSKSNGMEIIDFDHNLIPFDHNLVSESN